MLLSKAQVEEQGNDPCAFCMQSRRSTMLIFSVSFQFYNQKNTRGGIRTRVGRRAIHHQLLKSKKRTHRTAGMAKWQGNRFVSGRSGVRSPLPACLFCSHGAKIETQSTRFELANSRGQSPFGFQNHCQQSLNHSATLFLS